MLMFKIAFRNIFRQKRRTVLTALTMFGGFTLAAFSIGWADGSYNFIINMFTRNQLGHIQIHYQGYRDRPTLYKTIDDYQSVGEKLEGLEDVEQWTARLYSAGLVSIRDNTAGSNIIGIDPVRENAATNFDKKIVKGSSFSEKGSHETIIGRGLAKVLEAEIGDEVVVVSQAADGSIANDLYTLVGIIETGDAFSDRTSFYMDLKDAQELFVLDGRVHEIAIIVKSLNEVKKVARKIEEVLENPKLEVAPWQVFAKSFYQAMKADKEGMWIMLFIIMIIVAVGVLNTVLMSVLERQREYGVLKAVGTKPYQIFKLVLYEVALLAFFSIIIGGILGVLVNHSLSQTGIDLPQAFTYGGMEFKTMYTEVNARSLYIPGITVIISALLISIFPALRAAHTEPAKTMRMH
jgi:ABC-type lipoprotein release transport system permease subunit